MSEYLMLFRGGDGPNLQQSPEQWQAHMELWSQWLTQLAQEGRLVGAQPLSASGVTVHGTQKLVTDGPYLEGKEMVGGFLLVKADSYGQAVEVAKDCPILIFEDGNVEIREIQSM